MHCLSQSASTAIGSNSLLDSKPTFEWNHGLIQTKFPSTTLLSVKVLCQTFEKWSDVEKTIKIVILSCRDMSIRIAKINVTFEFVEGFFTEHFLKPWHVKPHLFISFKVIFIGWLFNQVIHQGQKGSKCTKLTYGFYECPRSFLLPFLVAFRLVHLFIFWSTSSSRNKPKITVSCPCCLV